MLLAVMPFVFLTGCGERPDNGAAMPVPVAPPAATGFQLEPLVLGPVLDRLPPPPSPVSSSLVDFDGADPSASGVAVPGAQSGADQIGPAIRPVYPAPTPQQTLLPLLPSITPVPGPALVAAPTSAGPVGPTPTSFPSPTPVPSLDVKAPISLEATVEGLRVAQVFDVAVWVWAGAGSPVDTVQVYLEFDPSKVEAVSVVAGERLEYQLQATTNNTLGQVGFAAGTLGNAAREPFTLCTVRFRAKAVADEPGTSVYFAPLNSPRHTKVINKGLDVTGELRNLKLIVR